MSLAANPKTNVAVVGASAAGLFAAYLLARAGRPVTVLERAGRLEPQPRTLIVTCHLRELLGALADGAVVNEIRRFELFADGRVATVGLHRPDLVIERARLIQNLARASAAAGAQIRLGQNFQALGLNGSSLRVLSRAGEVTQAGTVIGADGAHSRVAEAAGWPRQRTVPLVQALVRLPAALLPDTVRIWFIPEDTPYFYWLIPESGRQGVLGLIGEDGQETRRCLERFLEKRGLEPVAFQAARIPVYTRWVPVRRRLAAGEVYLVGDAAGQVKVTTVGGLVTGFRGAAGAAEAILNGGRSRELRALRRELDLHLLIRRVLHCFRQQDYLRLFDALNAHARTLLGACHRDHAWRLLWGLALRQPRFLLLGLRALLAGGGFPPER
jgi:flavin-dependent dehydrogenase